MSFVSVVSDFAVSFLCLSAVLSCLYGLLRHALVRQSSPQNRQIFLRRVIPSTQLDKVARRLHRYRARDSVADAPDVEEDEEASCTKQRKREPLFQGRTKIGAEVVVKPTPQAQRDPLVILYVDAKTKCNQQFGDRILDHACAMNIMTRLAEQICCSEGFFGRGTAARGRTSQ